MTDLQGRLRAELADRYTIEREAGQGGMATVFLAHDIKHDRSVALKVLHPELAAALGPERFLREIRVAARLNHPHILPLHDSGQVGSLLYYVMPFVDGESLRQRLDRDRQLPVEDAVAIARDVAAALDYAHRQGVVHRDIKPENVMLHEGEAMVTDFGIAKAVSAAAGPTITLTGMSVGTPAYMSPEQAAGDADTDGRSDIYSLGCVLYEMLAGAAPFAAPTPQATITRRFTEPAPSVRTVRPSVPESIDQAVIRALARVPADRFATAAQLAQALVIHSGTTPTGTSTSLAAQAAAAAKSIAVLPFVNMSNDPENEYFTDGIAEEIINALAKVQALHVAARTSSFAFKGKNEDIGDIGRKLKVATVVEGSVRKAGARLRVTAQLVNVADGYHLWSERYDRQLEDVFAIQDEIAENIVKALKVVLSEREKKAIEKAPAEKVEAYEHYLRGRQVFHQFRRSSMQFARRMFERALEVDPGYVRAWAGAADCCSFLYMYWDGSRSNLDGADSYSRKALELDPDLAEAHVARGLAVSLSKGYKEAEAEFTTAIRLDPRLFEAHYFFGRACFQQGKYVEAVEHYEEASRVRPEDYQTPLLISSPLKSLGRDADAAAAMRHGLQLAERHLELNPDDARALYLGGGALIQLGERERALEWATRAMVIDPGDSAVLYNVACVYALGGLVDEALSALERSTQNGFGHKAWIENDSDLDNIRGNPRFSALLQKL